MTEKPIPKFTIAELLRDVAGKATAEQPTLFTAAELCPIFGVARARTAVQLLKELGSSGWTVIPGRKPIVDFAGRHTSTVAYQIIPPPELLEKYKQENPSD